MESNDILMEEKKLMTEARYRNYMSNIDKALKNFEYSSEWADLISALGKLSKAISGNTHYQIIPRRIKISKRLAQCMHPALPSGVHLKALETYAVIFSKTGPERLATELFIYSAGLFPLLGYAAMNVRPNLLGIYETYFVPLGDKLRPALSGFLSGVLPGYESGLDHFERTNSLLTEVCAAVGPIHFYTVLWECVATNASVRLPAITYLLEHFNKRLGMPEQTFVMGDNRDVMMSGLCACLNDSVILVQRNTLEFLLLGFPMHTKLLVEAELVKLVTNGLNTILRRDMSLNRRLYAWLLGTEALKNSPTYEAIPNLPPTSANKTDDGKLPSYFENYSRHIVMQALINTLKFSLESTSVDLKPYRIMVSLLDKAEIGSAVLDFVLCDIIRTMSLTSSNVEVIKSANLLFAAFDPAYIWSFMIGTFEKSCKKSSSDNKQKKPNTAKFNAEQKYQCVVGCGDPNLVEVCFLTEFLLETISLEMYNETTRIYLPKVFLAVTQMLTIHLDNLTNDEIIAALKLCMKIVSRVQPTITSPIKLMPRATQQRIGEKCSVFKSQPLFINLSGIHNLEKSKSDSKLDQFAQQSNLLTCNHIVNKDEDNIKRSNSNQHMERRSPTKKKKAKSYSKLSELDKEICPDTGQVINPRQSSSDLDTPTSIKKLKAKTKQPRLRMSPKKSRPSELHITQSEGNTKMSTRLNNDMITENTPDCELSEESPKSAPVTRQQQQQQQYSPTRRESLIFQYEEKIERKDKVENTCGNDFTGSSILEKCIRQYEIFFEVYLGAKILNISSLDITNEGKKLQENSRKNHHTNANEDNATAAAAASSSPVFNADLNFFQHEEIYEHINPSRSIEIDNLFATLRVLVVNRSKQLHSLLNRSLKVDTAASDGSDGTDDASDNSETDQDLYVDIDDNTLKRLQTLFALRLNASLRNAIKLAVNLLVEMSTFPNCNKSITLDKTEKELPSWLKVLCLVACYTQNDTELQVAAITTLFDLISLLKSQIEHTTSPGVTFVVMLPLLKFGHVYYIERHTRIFQLLISTLWDYLGERDVDSVQICALLYQLHNCLESGLVERIIDNRMYAKAMQQHMAATAYETSDFHGNRQCTYKRQQQQQHHQHSAALNFYRRDRATDIHMMCVLPYHMMRTVMLERLNESESSSFRKFELLWHLGRDKQQATDFEKIQFKVLDTLALPPHCSLRTHVTKWLQSSLLRGDLSRLIKPLYKILLNKDTTRVGIVHIYAFQNNENQKCQPAGGGVQKKNDLVSESSAADAETSLEQDVYAISSEYGNIRYHKDVSVCGGKKRSPIRTFHKKIFGVALSSKNKTANFVSDETPQSAAATAATTIGLIINPLDNSMDFDNDPDNDTEQSKSQASKEQQNSYSNNQESCLGTKTNNIEEEETETEGVECEMSSDDNDDEDVGDVDDDEGCTDATIFVDRDYTDDSESSFFDSESEHRDTTSAEKEASTLTTPTYKAYAGIYNGTLNLKRFVGNCESVTELLSQHERTKNRKTYHLTREKTPGECSFNSNNTDETVQTHLSMSTILADEADAEETEDVHAADEYFDVKSEEHQVETLVDDILEQMPDCVPSLTMQKNQKKQGTQRKIKNKTKSITKHRGGGGGGGAKAEHNRKRSSCISKTSTDSNNSFITNELNKNVQIVDDDNNKNIDKINISPNTSNTSIKTANIEENKRYSSTSTLGSNKTKTKDWELTAQTLEKSKQNLRILRQTAATQLSTHYKRAYPSQHNGERVESQERLLMPIYQNHMLIYLNVYDTVQTVYAFHTLRNIIACDTRTFLCLSITTSLPSGTLKRLLTRHRKSIAGKGFSGNISTSEFAQSYRGCMHLEALLLLCLFYARSFFHTESRDSAGQPPTRADVLGNCRVQLESVELLTLICSELIEIVKGMGKGLASYLADLMARCKLQKVILHCLNFSVNTYGHTYKGASIDEKIVNFNNPHDDNLLAEALQLQLLRLLMVVIKLESEVILLKTELPSNGAIPDTKEESSNISPTRFPSVSDVDAESQTIPSVKYLPNCVISQQPMFLSAILSALQDDRLRHLHHNWTELVTASLNCFNFGALTNIVISVVHQLCNNIDQLVKMNTKEQLGLPPDYVISQLEAVTVLCHYCLLETSQQTTLSQLFNQAYPQTSSIISQHSQSGQLFNSIVHSLLPGVPGAMNTSTLADTTAAKNAQLMAARNAVLSHLPRIVSSLASVWDSELGQIRQIKQQLMEFLSPISLHHGVNFLTAIAVTWQERGEQQRKKSLQDFNNLSIEKQYQKNSMPQASAEQLCLVALVSSIRVMPMDSFVQTLHQVIKSPPPIHKPPAHLRIEVSALELFYFYMKSAPAPQLADSWPSLLALLRDGLTLTPPAQFIILMLLNEFVQRCPQMPFQDKKDIRDLHDVTSRLVDSMSNVAGSCLEQTTWLRRNLAVKEDISLPVIDGSSINNNNNNGATLLQQYSVQAQSILAALLANLLDVAYGSQEKDKVVSIVTTLLYNITPYLKNHTTRNIPSFYACSNLLASLSGYQYTRKAWRKDMMDLLLDNAFFQMDSSCLPFWKQIMDSLMTYDNTTFRELMSRVSLTQSGSLNIFTSREQEYEQRSMLLKRLAFVIFCSEFDQYHKYMPEIQEQLANSLRLFAMVPCVQAAVFLCFRVLLLRMSPDHVTSMWPIIIAEMVQVFLTIEQELKVEGDDFSQHLRMITGSDGSWPATASTNSLMLQTQTYHWRSVQLEASKILEMGCILPATLLPHFQMYRWAFVGTDLEMSLLGNIINDTKNGITPATELNATSKATMAYVPHIRRIAKLMDMKYTLHTPTLNHKRSKHLMLTYQQINSLQDLYGFFSTINIAYPNPNNYADVEQEIEQCLAEIEEILSADFLEKMSTSTTPR